MAGAHRRASEDWEMAVAAFRLSRYDDGYQKAVSCANGSRQRALDDKLREPTIFNTRSEFLHGGARRKSAFAHATFFGRITLNVVPAKAGTHAVSAMIRKAVVTF
jgi:hypothetical protein